MKRTIVVVAILLIAVSLYTWQKSEAGITNKELGSTGSVDISSWKTYRNEQYGFEFKYPQNLTTGEGIKSEPALPALLNTSLTDSTNQFISLYVFVYPKAQSLSLDLNSGTSVNFSGGTGIRINNEFFLANKDDVKIELWNTGNDVNGTFFNNVLSTFKFIQ